MSSCWTSGVILHLSFGVPGLGPTQARDILGLRPDSPWQRISLAYGHRDCRDVHYELRCGSLCGATGSQWQETLCLGVRFEASGPDFRSFCTSASGPEI